MMIWKMKKRNKVNIFMQFVCLSLATSLLFSRKPKNEQIQNRMISHIQKESRSSQQECYLRGCFSKFSYILIKLQAVGLQLLHWFLSRIWVNFPAISNFTGKHLYGNLFFNKVAACSLQACNFIKKENQINLFSCEFCE